MQFRPSGLEEDPSYPGQTALNLEQSYSFLKQSNVRLVQLWAWTWNRVPLSLDRVPPYLLRLRPPGLEHSSLGLQLYPIVLLDFDPQAWDRVPHFLDFGPIIVFDFHCYA